MQHFQSILIVVGLLAIGGVLIHGYLLSRKDKLAVEEATSKDLFSEKSSPEIIKEPADEVLADVSIINDSKEPEEENIDFSGALNAQKMDSFDLNINQSEATDKDEHLKLEQVDNETGSELSSENPDFESLDKDAVNSEEALQPQDLFIFNVVAKEDMHLGGHELLQFFLTSGFRFGEMSIFHRHQHSDGTGEVLFSIANMMAPGVFDPENMEQFKSEGVSFFLTVPNTNIDIKASFELMLRAVEQMAEEFDCIVLNAEREPMTQDQFIEYNHRLLHYI